MGLLLRLAALIMPAAARARWLEEWRAELEVTARRRGRAAAWRRVWGIVPHAIMLRWEEGRGMGTRWHDLRRALRGLRRRPGFTLVAVTMLALGIGGATAMVSLVNAVVVNPLPYPEGSDLVWMWGSRAPDGSGFASVSPPDLRDYLEADLGFSTLAAASFSSDAALTSGTGEPEQVDFLPASHDLLKTLDLEPTLGRSFHPGETEGRQPRVAMIGHDLWMRRFGGDPDVLGTAIHLDDLTLTVVGVLPPSLEPPFDASVWIPFTWGAPGWQERRYHFLRPMGRLAPGMTVSGVQERLDRLSQRLEASYPDTNTEWRPLLRPLGDVLVGTGKSAVLLFLVATILILGVACANVANLLLARAAGRATEMSVRSSLGATRGHLVRQLLTESLTLAAVGGVAGVGVAHLALWALVRFGPDNLPGLARASVDGPVLAAAVGITALVGILFGLAPALHLARAPARARSGTRTTAAPRIRKILAGAEVAMTVVVLTAAALLTKSLMRLTAVDPGFDPAGVRTATLRMPQSRYPDLETYMSMLDRIDTRLQALPGVTGVAMANMLPLSGNGGDTYLYPEEDPPAQVSDGRRTAQVRVVSDDYFNTLRIPVLRGRGFDRSDDGRAPLRMVVNQALVERFYQGENPVGHRMMVDLGDVEPVEIIGVVGDVRDFSLASEAGPGFYLTLRQSRGPTALSLAVRSTAPAPPAAALRSAVQEADPEQLLADLATYPGQIRASTAARRFQTGLLGGFAGVALLLALAGVYGMVASMVDQQRREIGIRMALGADRGRVVQRVVLGALGMGSWGVGIGLGVTLLVGPRLQELLYQVEPTDPTVLVAVPVALLAMVLVSSSLPARGAASVDPVSALRAE